MEYAFETTSLRVRSWPLYPKIDLQVAQESRIESFEIPLREFKESCESKSLLKETSESSEGIINSLVFGSINLS